MANKFFNKQVRSSTGGGKAPSPGNGSGSGSMSFKEKPGFNTGAPGKKQSDRSGGVKRCKEYPSSDGL